MCVVRVADVIVENRITDIYAETTMVTSLLRQVTNNYPWVLPVLGNNDCFDNCVGEKENDSITRNFTQIWSSYLKHVDSGQDFFRGAYRWSVVCAVKYKWNALTR